MKNPGKYFRLFLLIHIAATLIVVLYAFAEVNKRYVTLLSLPARLDAGDFEKCRIDPRIGDGARLLDSFRVSENGEYLLFDSREKQIQAALLLRSVDCIKTQDELPVSAILFFQFLICFILIVIVFAFNVPLQKQLLWLSGVIFLQIFSFMIGFEAILHLREDEYAGLVFGFVLLLIYEPFRYFFESL